MTQAMPSGGETEKDPSGWTTDTVRHHFTQHITDVQTHMLAEIEGMRRLLDERYTTQTKAVDAAFAAQQLAMQTALEAAEKAVGRALDSAALAVNKAEVAADKRFDAVNAFRSQLNDQAATFMPRSESEGEHKRHNERIHDIQVTLPRLVTREEATVTADRCSALTSAVNDRLTRMEGKDDGISSTMGYIIAGIGLIATILAIVASVMAFSNSGRIAENTERLDGAPGVVTVEVAPYL
jgi:hypothetical protein